MNLSSYINTSKDDFNHIPSIVYLSNHDYVAHFACVWIHDNFFYLQYHCPSFISTSVPKRPDKKQLKEEWFITLKILDSSLLLLESQSRNFKHRIRP